MFVRTAPEIVHWNFHSSPLCAQNKWNKHLTVRRYYSEHLDRTLVFDRLLGFSSHSTTAFSPTLHLATTLGYNLMSYHYSKRFSMLCFKLLKLGLYPPLALYQGTALYFFHNGLMFLFYKYGHYYVFYDFNLFSTIKRDL